MIMYTFSWKIALPPFFDHLTKIMLWRLQANLLRIEQDIDQNVQFYLKHRVAILCFDYLAKVMPYSKACKHIC